MRKQIAAANWKMNLTCQEGEALLREVLAAGIDLTPNQQAIFAVPFPYLPMACKTVADKEGYAVAAQNCSDKKSGAYTGEVSAAMLQSIGVEYCVVGHSERREYYAEDGQLLAQKVNACFDNGLTPIFCCGEPLEVREAEGQNDYVQQQLEASLFHLSPEQLKTIVVAYEPIWAIGTGKTASTAQAQEMHRHLRSVLADRYGSAVAGEVPILYGGSVKAGNAAELFACEDVDGGLVGGASLVAADFVEIIKALKR